MTTPVPQIPLTINSNFASFERYINTFYDGSSGILVVPIETTGRVKGTRGEFVTAVVDNLIVKKQFTNLYDNNTTADYDYYKTYIEAAVEPRDPCTATGNWPWENPNYKYIDVQKPFYKITNDEIISFYNDNKSQVVGIMFDTSLASTDQFKIVLDPCSGSYYQVDSSLAGSAYIEFIMTDYDASWGGTWTPYKYGIDEGGGGSGGGSGTVGPGTVNYLSMFDSTTSVGDSPLKMVGNTLDTYGIDSSGNVNVDGSINLNGKEVQKYIPSLSSSLAMPNDVGGIPAGTTVGELSGDTVESILNDLLFPTILAYIGTSNSVNLSGVSTTIAEVGTAYTPNTTATYNPGQIKNGDDTNGPNLTGDGNFYEFKLPNGTSDASISTSGNLQAHTFSSYNITFGSNNWSVTTNYDAGTGTYYDNKGNPVTNLDTQRVAGSVNDNSSTITGRRYAWWGYGVQYSNPNTSAGVRALPYNQFLNASNEGTFDISIPAGTQEVYFYIPDGKTVLVQYVESSFADVTGSFVSQGFTVNDAGGTPQNYEEWVSFIGTTGYPSTATYRVTIS